jgi:YD repeat-containing protein
MCSRFIFAKKYHDDVYFSVHKPWGVGMDSRFTRNLFVGMFMLGVMAGLSGPAQAQITVQDGYGHGWWATLPNGPTPPYTRAAGPFPDGISAALYSQNAYWHGDPAATKCDYTYGFDGIPGIATCIGYTSGAGFVRQGYGALHCAAGELESEGGGGCLPPPVSNNKQCMNNTGNPVDLVNGNKHQSVTDFTTQGTQPLDLTRTYNSQHAYHISEIARARFGKGWRTGYDAAALYTGFSATDPLRMHIILPDGREAVFVSSGGVMKPAYWKKSTNRWAVPRTDVDESVTLVGGTIWQYTGPNDVSYSFNIMGSFSSGWRGRLVEIRTRDGYTQTLGYDAAGKNIAISDNLGRSIAFTYNAQGLADSVTDPDGKVYRYTYKNQLVLPPGVSVMVSDHPDWALEKVIYPDATPGDDTDNPTLTYHYEDTNFRAALTGVTDEKGVRFASWTYDAQGRATSSQHAGGAELTAIAYDDVANTRTVTNPLGKQAIYSLETFQDQLRIKQIAGQPSANCVAADTGFLYDANGYIAQETDGKGNIKKYTRNAKGQELSRTEAFGTGQARTITTSWHAVFHLPVQIVAPGLSTTFSYDSFGLLTSRVETDATTHTVPYSTSGQTRTWGFSYTPAGLLDVADGPLPGPGDSINYDYNANGFLSQVTNEAGHVTQITSLNGRGQPLSVTDPNGIVSTLTYDPRGWLTSVTVDPGAAQAVTAIAYDSTGQITRITRPDGAFLDYTYDDARRLISISNAANEKITYTYDAMGNRTRTDILSAANALTATQSQTFDELGRLLRELGAGQQTTTHAYDKADNRISTLDPRGKLYGFAFDALNRLVSETDPAMAQIAYTNDAADNVTAVTDPRNNATGFVHNGWGEVIRETSPDRGITDYVRDARGLVTQTTDARGVISTYSYDALGRVTARNFPATPAENISWQYDSIAAGNKGVGRLTRFTDKSGETAYSYDARGNVTREARVIAGKAYVTGFAYDAADNLISLTYPSGRSVTYARDALGRVVNVSTRSNAAAAAVPVASTISYAPFGPLTGLTFGNGVVLSRSYDADYRLRTHAAAGVQQMAYAYDADGNIASIIDTPVTSAKPAGDQSFAYDDTGRLIAANSTVYGAYSYSYDLSGNRTASSANGVNESYTIALSSNRLLSVSSPLAGASRSFSYDAAGNAANDTAGAGFFASNFGYSYDAAGDLAQVTRNGATGARYTADARHLRVIRDLPGASIPRTHFIYAPDGALLAEHNGVSGAALNEMIWLPANDAGESLPLAWQVTGGATPGLYMVHADHLGRPLRAVRRRGGDLRQSATEPALSRPVQ